MIGVAPDASSLIVCHYLPGICSALFAWECPCGTVTVVQQNDLSQMTCALYPKLHHSDPEPHLWPLAAFCGAWSHLELHHSDPQLVVEAMSLRFQPSREHLKLHAAMYSSAAGHCWKEL